MLLEIFANWLKLEGCTNVHLAENGEEALQRIAHTSMDLLISDVRMPVMDGMTLVRRLGELQSGLQSIIFVSGFGDFDRREMYGLGVGKFLGKPLTNKDFLHAVETCLAERSELWRSPLEDQPRQYALFEMDGFAHTPGRNSIHLGRGGFSAPCTIPLSLGKIAFQISFPNGGPRVTGQGEVRWQSRADQTVGIEFDFLEAASRSFFLKQIAATKPRSFIPSS
jgi:CheY-like chemotaxis protein